MRALITGARGFVGSHLCRRLLADGAEVHAVSRTAHPAHPADGLRWSACDAVDAGAVRDLIACVKPDVVYHLGGMVTAAPDVHLVAPTFHSLLTSTINVLTAAADVGGCRVVLAGSLEEPSEGTVDTLVPASPYGAAKLAGAMYARMFAALYDTPVVNLRLFMTYGPGQQPAKLIPYTALALLRGEVPQLSRGDRVLDWVYVDDAIDALVLAARRPGIEGRTLDVGGGLAVSIRDVVTRIVRLIDPSIRPAFGSRPDRPDPGRRVADVVSTAATLGWCATTSLDEGLARTVEWYRQQRS